MFGKFWQWAEDSLYAAFTRAAQRFVNDMNSPCDDAGERPTLQLAFRPKEDEAAPVRKGRKAE